MSRSRYIIHETEYPYFLTSSIVDGLPLFANPEIAQIVLEGFLFLQKSRDVELYGYVIMENHIHFIAKGDDLSKKLKNFKSFSARQIINFLEFGNFHRLLKQLKRAKLKHKTQSKYQVWQEGVHAKQITTLEMMVQKLDYIHENPVKRGYVDFPEHWRYSSARNYLGLKALLPVTLYGG
ncbi:REP-associated tyrosine transposase [Rhodohalobacter sp. 8-1]|uniref:REP-associated tyrosine transposase n=1 Tax=Rhodohalobacter sp. 8-1 TaxID=3131972 RepID=UPI0030ED8792